jgi:crotonobetainyl-CoA:carnitine CoA-transferase CaiB-like acyl-CoA transferase
MRIGETQNAGATRFGRPLDGVRILAIEQMQALPYGTQLLSRLGADVVKVEPLTGESARGALPSMLDPQGRPVGSTFLRNNLGKRSISVDLKHPEGRALILRIAPHFDVVCENFKTGTMDRLGLGYEDISHAHPSVIYASVSGFGRADGPYNGLPAYAPVAEGMSGLYYFKTEPGRRPTTSPVGSLGDTGTSLFAVIGVLAALLHRANTGEGQVVDISMYDAMVALNDAGINYWSMGLENGGNAPLINEAFLASDGYFVVQVIRTVQFERLADVLGKPEWKSDPTLASPAQWLEHLDDIIRPAIESWASNRTKLDAALELAHSGIASGPIHTQAEVVADAHVRNRHMIVEMDRTDGVEGTILSPGNPVKLSKMAEGPWSRVPWCGEHTVELLSELGLEIGDIEKLVESRVIGSSQTERELSSVPRVPTP